MKTLSIFSVVLSAIALILTMTLRSPAVGNNPSLVHSVLMFDLICLVTFSIIICVKACRKKHKIQDSADNNMI